MTYDTNKGCYMKEEVQKWNTEGAKSEIEMELIKNGLDPKEAKKLAQIEEMEAKYFGQ